MATKLNARSPFYTASQFDQNLTKGELLLYVYTGTKNTDKGTAKYNLTKSNTISYQYTGFGNLKGISFEISELVRDYLDVAFNGTYTNYNRWVTVEQLFHISGTTVTGTNSSTGSSQLIDSSVTFAATLQGKYVKNEATGAVALITDVDDSTLTLNANIFPSSPIAYTAGLTYNTADYISYDGYGYFKDGRNPELSQSYLQSNKKMYRPQDHNIRIAVDTDVATSATFRLKGQTVRTQTFTASNESDVQVVYFNVGSTDADTYKQRVKLDDGTVEDTPLLREFFGAENVGEVDQIYISDANKTEVITIETEPCSIYDTYKAVFVNKFGVLQDLYFTRKSTESFATTGETFKANTFDYTIASSVELVGGVGNKYNSNKHQVQQFNKLGKESITLNTGYISEDYNEVFKELMLSEQVWLVKTDTADILPVIPKTNSLTFKTSINDNLIQYSVDFDMAFDKINSIR